MDYNIKTIPSAKICTTQTLRVCRARIGYTSIELRQLVSVGLPRNLHPYQCICNHTRS